MELLSILFLAITAFGAFGVFMAFSTYQDGWIFSMFPLSIGLGLLITCPVSESVKQITPTNVTYSENYLILEIEKRNKPLIFGELKKINEFKHGDGTVYEIVKSSTFGLDTTTYTTVKPEAKTDEG